MEPVEKPLLEERSYAIRRLEEALQVIMGSDRIREVLGAVRVSRGEEHPTLFLEKQS